MPREKSIRNQATQQSLKLHKGHQAGHRMYKLKWKCCSEYETCTNLSPSQKSRCVLRRTKSILTCDCSTDSTSDKTLIHQMTRVVALKLSYPKMSSSPNWDQVPILAQCSIGHPSRCSSQRTLKFPTSHIQKWAGIHVCPKNGRRTP